MALCFVVPREQDNWCVRDVLRAAGLSLTALRRAKRTPPGILADGAPVWADTRVAAGVRLQLPAVPEAPPAVGAQALALPVLWQDDCAAVVEKPAGMAMYPAPGHAQGTLANAWLGLAPAVRGGGGFHPLWRLDAAAGGLVLLAREAAAQPFLQRGCRKLYAALLAGVPPAPAGVVDLALAPVPGSRVRQQPDAAGRAALTRWRVLAAADGRALAVFWLGTGRTHQIRVHMAALGCPLWGDGLYGAAGAPGPLALHCMAAAFRTPAGRAVRCESAFPTRVLAAAGWRDIPAALAQLHAAAQWVAPAPAPGAPDELAAHFCTDGGADGPKMPL